MSERRSDSRTPGSSSTTRMRTPSSVPVMAERMLKAAPAISAGGARVDRPDGVDVVGVGCPLVGAVAQHAGEPQRNPAWIARACLHAVEGDLNHEFGPNVDGVVVTPRLEPKELFGLPGKKFVGEALERLAQHHEPAGAVAGAQMQIRQQATTAAVTPFDGQDDEVEGVPRFHFHPAGTAPARFIRSEQ